MAEIAFTLYRGFLIVEYSETDFRAYRNRGFYAGNISSHTARDQSLLSQIIDSANDQGDFSEVEYYTLLQDLGRTGTPSYAAEPKYPTNIMNRVRQYLGLEEGDTSRDSEINDMSHGTIFNSCLVWEGIIGYDSQILGWIHDIYGVELS